MFGVMKRKGMLSDSTESRYEHLAIEVMEDISEINKKAVMESRKMGDYDRYAALTAMGTYIILSPKKAQEQSPPPPGIIFEDN
jgi:hypothetical protein